MPELVSVGNGHLVRMMRVNGTTKVDEVSLSAVGHRLKEGWVIVDASNTAIPARRAPVRRQMPKGKILYDLEVIDPGPQYQCAFDPSAPPQAAQVHKA